MNHGAPLPDDVVDDALAAMDQDCSGCVDRDEPLAGLTILLVLTPVEYSL